MTEITSHRPRSLLAAVIAEAQRRARRREFALAVGALLALLIGGGVWAGLALSGGTGAAPVHAPAGFTIVSAQGSVEHALIQYRTTGWRIADVASGRERAASVTEELWYDGKGGLLRDLLRVNGRTRTDRAGTCADPCRSTPPLNYLRAFPWPPSTAGFREAGTGTFEGRDVLWLEPSRPVPANQTSERIGLDPQTHKTLVVESFTGGRETGLLTVAERPDLGEYQFVVPKGGVQVQSVFYEPNGGLTLGYGFAAARKAFGKAPLWVGARFGHYALRSVVSGRYALPAKGGEKLLPVKFVRLYYGSTTPREAELVVEEFATPPYFQRQAPRGGSLERDGLNYVRLIRGGVMLRIWGDPLRFGMTRAHALAVVRALRPLPAGLRTLPTLHEQ
jgi:hypothetical protein